MVGRCRRVPSVDNTRCWHMVPVKWRLSLVRPGAGYDFCFTFLLFVAAPVAADFLMDPSMAEVPAPCRHVSRPHMTNFYSRP